jgi:hypothetical protein
MSREKIIFILLVGLGLLALILFWDRPIRVDEDRDIPQDPVNEINSFEECVAAGFPVMESYPPQCTDGNQTFMQDIGNGLEKDDLIQIDLPRPNDLVSSPLEITGEARGAWFFEASFPVRLIDADGVEMASGIASAEGEWMTENFVPFNATLEFDDPTTRTGVLILEKDNPSGLPENADELRVPLRFK